MRAHFYILGLTIFSLFNSHAWSAQSNAPAKTNIPGTGFYLNPPLGFELSTRFPGFIMNEFQSSIVVTEMSAPYPVISKKFTKPALKGTGMALLSKEAITFNGKKGTLIHIQQSNYGISFLKWVALVGDSKHTAIITASFPEFKKELLSKPIRNSILSMEWRTPKSANPFLGLNFRIQDQPNLKLAKKMGNSIILTTDGKFSPKLSKDPFFMLGASYTQGIVVDDKKKFSTKRFMKTKQMKNIKISSTREVTHGGLKGIEILGTGKDEVLGHDVLIYQVILFDKRSYFVGQGFSPVSEKKKYTTLFKQVMHSFKPKMSGIY